MKYTDIIGQLRQWLPFFTDFFSDTLISTDAINVSGDVTITLGSQTLPTGLQVGDQITVSEAFEAISVLESNRDDGVIFVTTKTAHDYTSDIDNQRIRITGTGYDQTFTLKYVPNRLNLELIDDSQPLPPVNSIINQANLTTFSGLRTITAIDTVSPSITYTVDPSAGPIIKKDIKVHFLSRITGAIDPETMVNSYTAQTSSDDGWLFVIMGAPQASKSRTNGNDAVDTLQSNQDFRQILIFNFSIFVIVPNKGTAKTDTSSMSARDKIEDLRKPIFKCMLGWHPEVSDLTAYGTNTIVYAGEQNFAMAAKGAVQKAAYIHRFNFQWCADLTSQDTFLSIDTSRAFRDILLELAPNDSALPVESEIDLDDHQLQDDTLIGFGSGAGIFGG